MAGKQLKVKGLVAVGLLLLAPLSIWGPTLIGTPASAPPRAESALALTPPGRAAGSPSAEPAAASRAEPQYFLKDYEFSSAEPSAANWGSTLGDVFFKLIVVLGLIFLATKGLQRLNTLGRLSLNASTGRIAVLETTHLAPNRSLHLVQVGDKIVLIGSTPGQFTPITEIADPEAVARLRNASGLTSSPADPGNLTFQHYLGSLLGPLASTLGHPAPASPATEGPASEVDVQGQLRASHRFLEGKIADLQRVAAGFRRA